MVTRDEQIQYHEYEIKRHQTAVQALKMVPLPIGTEIEFEANEPDSCCRPVYSGPYRGRITGHSVDNNHLSYTVETGDGSVYKDVSKGLEGFIAWR